MPLPSKLLPCNSYAVRKALERLTPSGTIDLIQTPRRPSEQFARAEALAEILIRLALEVSGEEIPEGED